MPDEIVTPEEQRALRAMDDIDALEAAILRNPEAVKAYTGRGTAFGSCWFPAVIDLLRAHARQGGSLLDGVLHILVQEHAAKTRTLRDEIDAARMNLCPRCHRPFPLGVPLL
jgi:hypothetical protein